MYDKPSHAALRNRWLEQAPKTIYDGLRWLRYTGQYWQAIADGFIEQEVDRLVCEAEQEGIRPTDALINSVVGMARKRTFIDPLRLNADPDYLPCQNGVLHLPTRILYPHSPDYYQTSILPYAYDPQASATRWQYALNTTLPDDVIRLLQEFGGYCTTTETKLETAMWLYGPKGSGKSTIIHGLSVMLGERAGMLGLAEIQRSRFALCNIPGKTMLFATEQPTGATYATNIINRIISGETITVEKKHKDQFDIIPRAKICWAMNNLPTVTDVTDGIFRRVKIIEFMPREGDVIPEIKEEIAREGAGILNWALEGLARLQHRLSFEIPESVSAASANYERNSDYTALFISECCELDKEYREKSGTLFSRYKEWAADIRLERTMVKSLVALAEDWRRLGFHRVESSGYTYWEGIRLKRTM